MDAELDRAFKADAGPGGAPLDLEEECKYLLHIDPHCHILPGVDDGSKDLEMSLAMAGRALALGCRTMVATPHGCHPALKCEGTPEELRYRVEELNTHLGEAGLPLQVLPGTEILLNDKVPELFEAGKLLTWADQNRYVLLELGFHKLPACAWDVVDYFLQRELVPIIAHPERYTWLPEQPDAVDMLLERGCWLQINVMSINGYWGEAQQRMAIELMRKTQRWIVGTDSHSDADRYWEIGRIASEIQKFNLQAIGGQPQMSTVA